MIEHPFHGTITALITPFKNDELDLDALAKLIEHQIKGGIKAIILGGSTGEGVTLSIEEYFAFISEAITISRGRLKIIAGCSSSSTKAAISMLSGAERLGVDAIMCMTPPYNRPSQEGLYRHFKAVHDATNLPIMLYTFPPRTGVNFDDETILKLAQLPRIVALKDFDVERTLRLSVKLPSFALMSGDDMNALTNLVHGGSGIISVVSNILPVEVDAIQEAWDKNDTRLALTLHQKLLPIYKALFVESNPVPVKYVASLMDLCSPEVRLPLCELTTTNKEILSGSLNHLAPKQIW
jgi:4-hydroxy-tetrahydrodipicolinate synthase